MSTKALKFVIPPIVVIAGIAAAAMIASARKAPPRVDRPALGPLVEVLSTEVNDVPVVITGHGKLFVFLERHFPWLVAFLVRMLGVNTRRQREEG